MATRVQFERRIQQQVYDILHGRKAEKTLGKSLREWRLSTGYTQRMMSQLMGVSQQRFQQVECGRVGAGDDFLGDLSKVLEHIAISRAKAVGRGK